MNDTLWLTLLGMCAATFLIRASFLVFGERLRFPTAFVTALGHVPVAVLTAIVVPAALAPAGTPDLSATNPYLVGTLLAGLLAWKSGRTLLAVVAGFALFALMRCLA